MSKAIENEVWEFAPEELTPSAFILLLALADSAGDGHRMAWLAVPTLQQKARGMSLRNVFYCLAQLKKLGVLEDVPETEWPPEAFLYESVVRRIRPREFWEISPTAVAKTDPPKRTRRAKAPGDAKFAPPKRRVTRSAKEVTPDTGGVQNLHPSKSFKSSYEEPTVLPSRRPGDDVQSTPRRGSNKRREVERRAAAEAELDPAAVLGLDPPVDAAAPAKSGRRRPGPDTPMGLALEFQAALRKLPDSAWGPSPVNVRALAKNFSDWRRDGVTTLQIRAAINGFVADPGLRNPRSVPWTDFLAKRALLLDRAARGLAAIAAENDPNYWRTDRGEDEGPGLNNRDYWT